MAVTIPLTFDPLSVQITFRSSATSLDPTLGGPSQRISRMGDRWVYRANMQPMSVAMAGPLVVALNQGLSQKAVCVVRQPNVSLARWSNGTVSAAVAGGSTLSHTGGGAAKFVGQFFSIVKDGVRYLHQISAVNGAALTFYPMLKTPLAVGDVLEFGAPKIEGFVSGNSQDWSVGFVGNVGCTFVIEEAQ